MAKRTVIESDRDARMFLSFVARQVRAGLIEVHAYVLMHTHFHLLLRSPDVRLSEAMRRIQDGYVRWFNRSRRRDGPLFRGRFGSRLVESDAHWFAVVPYIHDNPVSAGLAASAEEHAFSSAGHYSRRAGPPWLRMDLVLNEFAGRDSGGPSAPLSPGTRWLVGRWLHGRRSIGLEDPLDEVAGEPPERVRRWMERKAKLADGTRPGWVMALPDTVRDVLSEKEESGSGTCMGMVVESPPDWKDIEAGVLRAFCGMTHGEVALRLGLPAWRVRAGTVRYSALFRESAEFRGVISRVLHECLARDYPPGRIRWGERMATGWATAEPSVRGRVGGSS